MGIVRHIAQGLDRLVAFAPQVKHLPPSAMVERFLNMSPANGLWFDHGTGNASTLINQARRFTGAKFVGVDFESTHLETLATSLAQTAPDNLTYGLFHQNNLVDHVASNPVFVALKMFPHGWPKHVSVDDETDRLIRAQWGTRFAGVASLFYPTTRGNKTSLLLPLIVLQALRDPALRHSWFSNPFEQKMATLLWSLADGGQGVLVLENKDDVEHAIRYLKSQPRVTQIQVTEEKFSRSDLERMEIVPYATKTIDPFSGRSVDVVFDEPYMIVFST